MEKHKSGKTDRRCINQIQIIMADIFQMLNCISGMVEKTQSAISILQQRQAEVTNVRNAEEAEAYPPMMKESGKS